MRRHRLAAVTAAVLTVTAVPAYAATVGLPADPSPTPSGSSSASGSSSSSTASAKPYTPPEPPEKPTTPDSVTTITPSSTFAVQVDPSRRQRLDGTWPNASSVFTAKELAAVVPGVDAIRASECETGLPNGGRSARNTRCTLGLQRPGSSGAPSRVIVQLRGFGPSDVIGAQWSKTMATQTQRAKSRPGLYTYFPNGSLGVTAAHTDGTTTRVLVTKGQVSGEIWFSGIGFTDLKTDYAASRQNYRERVVPALIKLLGAKMAANRPAPPPTSSPSPSQSPSSSGSPSPSSSSAPGGLGTEAPAPAGGTESSTGLPA